MSQPHDTFFAADRDVWRAWLEEHHASRDHVWLIMLKKHVAEPSVTLGEAVEEALCFGWIDGRLRRIDERSHMLRFSPRKRGSDWAASNKARVERLTGEGRMTAAGLAVVAAAKADGSWDRLDEQRLDEAPAELEAALSADPAAQTRWSTWAPSLRRQYVYWIVTAKRPETRARRVAEVVRLAAGDADGAPDAASVEAFFTGRPGSLSLFRAVRAMVEAFGRVETEVKRTQISFRAKRVFATVWLPQTWVKGRPAQSVTLAVDLGRRVDDPRIAEAVEARPGHWTHHIVITDHADLDRQVRDWLREAYERGGGSARLVR